MFLQTGMRILYFKNQSWELNIANSTPNPANPLMNYTESYFNNKVYYNNYEESYCAVSSNGVYKVLHYLDLDTDERNPATQ